MAKRLTTTKLLAACGILIGAVVASAAPGTIDLSTGARWTIHQVDTVGQVVCSGRAFTYGCLGNVNGPQCLSVTSTGFADGTWLPRASPAGFAGIRIAQVDVSLPARATRAQLFCELLGLDAFAQLALIANGNGLVVNEAFLGDPQPSSVAAMQRLWASPAPYRLPFEVFDGPGCRSDRQPVPIGGGDGIAVLGRFVVSFVLPDHTVPEPGALACA